MTKLNSIGIAKEPKDTLVVVAMSGGVDSSTVAAMMKKEGYKVIGITLKLYNDTKETAQSKQCCAGQDIMDAKRVADKLKIEHKILYYQNKFKEGVIDNFIDSYLNGETPIPCVQCNQTVKFTDLFEEAKNLKADALVTGHYVKSVTEGTNTEMYRGIDTNRDQSYFLFNTTKEQLNFLRFPLGNLLKDETRDIARKLDLNVADKPDSQDICFVPNGDYASVIEKFRPNSFNKGNIKNMEGEVIGVHDGIINYTIGQRKGIKISDKNPLYVIKIIADKNEIIVGNKENLAKTKIDLKNLNIITKDKKDFEKELFVKVRSTGKLIKAKIEIKNTFANVNLLEEEQGIAPGQACVFYSKNSLGYKVLGGGWIIN
ncbi:tRNA 2-thiouridine(34) synthase MnmA [Candidatus Pelagibacter bacterium]|jgi:tRNA-specific 2-thiouridylase|nr:tRNA 2-thiouridine(34) synthase MnmA [Candidatus Pelagibacter bacterium]MDB2527462.1 tRNA 2-thiouridine(34) synthase MnmA [Candidatus Pelagibacter bacterium]|tara:strand:- start:788 stop:1903 length:1116 start_codon:yes stop_codon:yes gene_type:complete